MLGTIKEKVINQKQKQRNIKKFNVPKANTSLKKPKKERQDLLGARTQEFLYNIEKRKKLNSLKEKSYKITGFMNTLGSSFKSFNRNLNSEINPLMMKNLTNISFRRSLFIRQKLRNIDKMNKEFDKEYLNPIDLNETDNDLNDNESKLKKFKEEEYKERMKKESKLRNAHFRTESLKIFNILYKKHSKGICFSEYKKNKKLNELKDNIDFICGVDIKGKNGNNQKDPKKVSHYTVQTKSPSFIREKSKNAMFTPSVKYNKSKVIYNKKYELSKEKIDQSKKYLESISSTINISPNKTIRIKIKGRNHLSKTEENKNNLSKYMNSLSSKELIKDNSKKSISPPSQNLENNKIYNYILPEIKQKEDDENIYKSVFNSRKNIFSTFSPKQRHISFEQNLSLQKRNNFSPGYRCNTANNISLYKNRTKRKNIFPLLKNLLNDNYSLKHDLKFGFNIINNMINDYKKIPKKKKKNIEVNIEKIRKELKLNISNSNVIDEIDVVMNNVKKMEKLIKKKDVYFLRNIAKTVLREDMLANKNLLFDNNSLIAKLKQIGETRKKGINKEENDANLNQQERVEMIKLFKNDGPDFFSTDYLSSLIKRYKTLHVK